MSLTPWKDAVIERLAEGNPAESVPGFGAGNVFREGVPEEVQLERLSNRQVAPYVAVWFGQRVGGPAGFRGITGVRRNAHIMYMLVQVMASDGHTVNKAVDLVSDLLLGFVPGTGYGELSEDSSATIRRPMDVSGVRSRYAVPVAYSGTVDT